MGRQVLEEYNSQYADCPLTVEYYLWKFPDGGLNTFSWPQYNKHKCTVAEELGISAFNTQNFGGSHDPGHAPFQKLSSHVQTVRRNLHVKQVCSFSCFGEAILS